MTAKMVAVGYAASLPISDERSSSSSRRRCRGRVIATCWCASQAVSVNPVDVKVRMRKQGTEGEPVILGWDAAGIVEARGTQAARCSSRATTSTTPATSIARHRRAFHWSTSASSAASRSRSSFAEAAPAAHDADGLGADVRPHRREARRRGGPPLAPGRRRRRRRGLDRHPARAQAHRPHRRSPPPRVRETRDWVQRAGRTPRHRPQQAVRAAAEGGRVSRASTSCWRSTGTSRNAAQITEVIAPQGRIGADRRHGLAEGVRHGRAVGEVREHASRADVHPLDATARPT